MGLALAAVLLIGAAAEVRGEEKVPHRVPKVNSEIRVDGTLDEHIWQEALVLDINYEVRPGENIPPPVETEFLMAYDESQLYCAFRAYDPDPSAICAHLCDRDHLWDDDWVALVLDTFNDQRRNFLLVCNPLGVQADNIEVTGSSSAEWDPIWESAGKISEEGYVVEMAVPFSSLRFQRSEADQVWGIDAIRSYPRRVRHHIGLFPRDRDNNCYLCQAEKVIGFAGATPGKNIQLDPTFSTIHTQAREEIDTDFGETSRTYDLGLTARWGFTPNLTLSGIINPDFSQVEADAAQLDINTQFAIYYDEKRPFFLEGTDFFQSNLNVVHTRTLVDPLWGAKVTGKEGPSALGFFTVRDDITNLLIPGSEGSDGTSLDAASTGTVARYRHDLGSSSTLGLFLTDREAKDYHNRLAGVDGVFRFAKTEMVRFQALGTNTAYPDTVVAEFGQPEGDFEGYAYEAHYVHGTRSLDWYAFHRTIDPDYRADLGFQPKVGYRYSEAGWGHTWQNDGEHWYNILNLGSGYEYEDKPDGTLLHKGFTSWFDYAGPSRSEFSLYAFYGKIRYDEKEFDRGWVSFWGGFWPAGWLYMDLEGTIGDGIDYRNTRGGNLLALNPELNCKCGRHLELWLYHYFERLDVAQGRLYTGNISRLKAVYQFNVRSFVRAILQYRYDKKNAALYTEEVDSKEESLQSQVLFSYKVNPQTMLFVGYSDFHYGDQDYGLTQTDRTVFAKIGYAWVP
jgi:hypothetical protein